MLDHDLNGYGSVHHQDLLQMIKRKVIRILRNLK
jgi:hypothetical protein